MENDYCFDIMYKDELVSEVSFVNGKLLVKKHNNNVAIQPFHGGEITPSRVEEFLLSRCFRFSRPDKEDLLKALGLEVYNPFDIVSKTHGHMYHDCLWVRFPGENLKWADVENGTC